MRIHSKNCKSYLQNLVTSISKDPASLQSWNCTHISANSSEYNISEPEIELIQKHYKNIDCELFFIEESGDLFLVSKEITRYEIEELASQIAQHLWQEENHYEIAIYDLFDNWHEFRTLLVSKIGEPALPKNTTIPTNSFGEVAYLQDVFLTVKKSRKARQPLYVLLVEDDPVTRKVVSNLFKDNYAVITAQDASEAVSNYLTYAPDIVFLDINLPDANGFQVLQQIMASDSEAYVVMFSGNSYLDNVTNALTSGASGFVSKPFNKEKMRHYITDSAMHHQKYCN